MKTLSILGSGWLGLPLTKELSNKYDIKLSTKTNEKKDSLISKNITPHIVDIDNISNAIDKFLDSDTLIVNIPSKNVDSFKSFVEILKKSSIKKVIFVSSTSVYNDCNAYVREDDIQCYSNSELLDIENLFLNSTNFETTILRFGGLIGYDRNLVKFFQNRTVSSSKAPVNMIHRDDCINIIEQILSKDIFGEVFNCCASTHPTKTEFYSYCAQVSNLEVPHFDDELYSYKIIDNKKLKDKIGYNYVYDDLLDVKFEIDEDLEYEESDDKLFRKN